MKRQVYFGAKMSKCMQFLIMHNFHEQCEDPSTHAPGRPGRDWEGLGSLFPPQETKFHEQQVHHLNHYWIQI